MKTISLIVLFLLAPWYVFCQDQPANVPTQTTTAVPTADMDKRIDSLEKRIDQLERINPEVTATAYQLTNDRINFHLSTMEFITAIMGLILAIAGVYVGYESVKSSKKREEAMETLETAKRFVEERKNSFEALVDAVKNQFNNDVSAEVSKVKSFAQEKTKEIASVSIDVPRDEIFQNLSRRLEFIEKVGIPDDPEVLLSKTKLLSTEGKHQEAIDLCQRIIALKPDFKMAYWTIASELTAMKKYEESNVYYEKYEKLSPNQSETHNNLGVNYFHLGRYKEAVQRYELAIGINKNQAIFYRNQGLALKKLNRNGEATAAFNQAVTLNPTEKNYDELIRHLTELKKFDEIILSMDDLILKVPTKQAAGNTRKVNALLQLKRFDDAITILQGLRALNYDMAVTYRLLSQAQYGKGDRKEAFENLSQSLQVNPQQYSLYVDQAELIVDEDPERAYELVLKAGTTTKKPVILQGGAVLFHSREKYEYEEKLYAMALQVNDENGADSSDSFYLNKYELLMLTGKLTEAKTYGTIALHSITGMDSKIAWNLLTDAMNLAEGLAMDQSKYDFMAQSNPDVEVKWNFIDMVNFLKKKKVPEEEILGYKNHVNRFNPSVRLEM